MGVLAVAALAGGGQVHGVITQALQAKEIAHQGLTSLEVVKIMHERKAAMADMESDPGTMLDRLSAWKPVLVEKWLDRQDR